MKKEDCIFCKIAGGEIPSNTIYENSEFKVIMDIAPASKGHVLIIPKEHFKDIYEIDAITAGKLFQLATVVARALKEVLHCDGLYHFHMHLIPRYEGDDVTIGWKEHSTEDIDMEQLRQDIKKAL